jgi:hypothetical protein
LPIRLADHCWLQRPRVVRNKKKKIVLSSPAVPHMNYANECSSTSFSSPPLRNMLSLQVIQCVHYLRDFLICVIKRRHRRRRTEIPHSYGAAVFEKLTTRRGRGVSLLSAYVPSLLTASSACVYYSSQCFFFTAQSLVAGPKRGCVLSLSETFTAGTLPLLPIGDVPHQMTHYRSFSELQNLLDSLQWNAKSDRVIFVGRHESYFP